MGQKAASARAAGYKGSSATLINNTTRILKKANISLGEYIIAHGVGVGEALACIAQGMKAKNRRAFINKKNGEVVVSRPFLDAASMEQRRKAAELALALNGVTTRRSAVNVNVDRVSEQRRGAGVRELSLGDYDVE